MQHAYEDSSGALVVVLTSEVQCGQHQPGILSCMGVAFPLSITRYSQKGREELPNDYTTWPQLSGIFTKSSNAPFHDVLGERRHLRTIRKGPADKADPEGIIF